MKLRSPILICWTGICEIASKGGLPTLIEDTISELQPATTVS